MYRLLILIIPLLALSACTNVRVTDYAGQQPELLPATFFQGNLSAHGLIKDRGGRVIRRFNADIQAGWTEDVGTLVEDFEFDDGELQQRIWTLTPTANNSYAGTAGDVVGKGKLEFSGNSMFLDYVLRIPYGEGSIDVRVDDRMYLVSPDVLVNESTMTKFGFEVGSILLVIIRVPVTRQ